MRLKTLTKVTSVWAAAADDVWVVSDYTLMRFDGVTWSVAPGAQALESYFSRVWGSAANDVWASAGNLVFHFDGQSWIERSPEGTTGWQAGHALAADDCWLVSTAGESAHWDGMTWTIEQISEENYWLQDIWAVSSDDVWAVGDMMGHVFHYDGSTWTDMGAPLEFPGQQIESVWGLSSDDVWMGGGDGRLVHWDGSGFETLHSIGMGGYGDVAAIDGTDSGQFWAAGEAGALGRYRDETWSIPGIPEVLGKMDLRQLTVIPNGDGFDAWAVGRGQVGGDVVLRRGTGGVWTREETPSYLEDTTSIAGLSASDVWVGLLYDDVAALHWDGSEWLRTEIVGYEVMYGLCNMGDGYLYGVAGDRSGSEQALSLLRYDGTDWESLGGPVQASGEDSALFCAAGQVWLSSGALWRWDGQWHETEQSGMVSVQELGEKLLFINHLGQVWRWESDGFVDEPVSGEVEALTDAAWVNAYLAFGLGRGGLYQLREGEWSQLDGFGLTWWLDEGGIVAEAGEVFAFSLLGTVLHYQGQE